MIQPHSRKKQTWRLSKEKTKTIICDLFLKMGLKKKIIKLDRVVSGEKAETHELQELP